MSTIKGKFNIETIAMFVGCLALAVVITQPILAKAGNEGGIPIDTTFSDAKKISLDTLNVSNSMNVGDSQISDGKFCNSEGTCLSLDGDMLSVNKIKIGNGDYLNNDEVILISGNTITYKKSTYPFENVTLYLNALDEFFDQYDFHEELRKQGLTDTSGNPMRTNEGRMSARSFRDVTYNDGNVCDEPNKAGTFHYVETSNGSQLIMCMKVNTNEYSGVVLKEFKNGIVTDNVN